MDIVRALDLKIPSNHDVAGVLVSKLLRSAQIREAELSAVFKQLRVRGRGRRRNVRGLGLNGCSSDTMAFESHA
eukprot:5448542-Amphidinium_carterae.1